MPSSIMEDEPQQPEESTEKAASEQPQGNIISREIEDEMRTSYLDYSMSVIVGRALPDIRDGLKPVHRRILYAMHSLGMASNKPFKKCARIVGEVIGKFHPHGDLAVYDALARMVQDFSLRYPLILGQGNFGSMDGDSPAAMRYTEAKLARTAESLLEDLEKETVLYVPNFDDTLTEPSVLPSRFPNMLVNGSSGIAVGMATNIPPHNLKEASDAIIALIDDPELGPLELMKHMKGPDFPTGGQVVGTMGIRNYFTTGKGRILVRGKTVVEDHKGKSQILITEIPYQVNKSLLVQGIAELIKDKIVDGISDLRDESDKHGVRIVIELKTGANADVILNQLYHHSNLQVTFGAIMLAIVDGAPKVLNLREFIRAYITYRQQIVRKRTEYERKTAEARAHILEGLIIALNNLDKTINLIRKAKNAAEAKQALLDTFSLSDKQALAILEMRLQRLTSMEQEGVRKEHQELLELITRLKAILADETKILDIIKKETQEMKENYGDDRRTEILNIEEEDTLLLAEDLIEPEDMVITFTHTGYIKRTSLSYYREQRRGGKGIIAAATREEDTIKDVFVANTLDHLLVFSNQGKIYWLKTYQLPETSRQALGSSIRNFVPLVEGEVVTAFIPLKNFEQGYLIMATEKGVVKKTDVQAFSHPRKGGIIALTLDPGDSLIGVVNTAGTDHVLLATAKGNAIRFKETDVRAMGRSAGGVRGIRVHDDKVIDIVVAPDDQSLLTITQRGFGKRTKLEEYRIIRRGGQGVINIQCSERNGAVVAVLAVREGDQVMFISKKGVVIRTPVRDIREIGRNTQGVRLMTLENGDMIVSAAHVIDDNIEQHEAARSIPSIIHPPHPESEKPADELDYL